MDRKPARATASQLTLFFGPLLLALSALVGHADPPRAGERQLLTLRVHTRGAAFAFAVR